jgi:hypothetical protein
MGVSREFCRFFDVRCSHLLKLATATSTIVWTSAASAARSQRRPCDIARHSLRQRKLLSNDFLCTSLPDIRGLYHRLLVTTASQQVTVETEQP